VSGDVVTHFPDSRSRTIDYQPTKKFMKCICSGCGNEHEIDELEERARTETVCRGCNGEKETGLIVCWACFTYREDIVPFKDFDGTLSLWLQSV
jgi:hypothetical protein